MEVGPHSHPFPVEAGWKDIVSVSVIRTHAHSADNTNSSPDTVITRHGRKTTPSYIYGPPLAVVHTEGKTDSLWTFLIISHHHCRFDVVLPPVPSSVVTMSPSSAASSRDQETWVKHFRGVWHKIGMHHFVMRGTAGQVSVFLFPHLSAIVCHSLLFIR